MQRNKAESENSGSLDMADVDMTTYDLSAKNPTKKNEAELRDPQEILDEIYELDAKSTKILSVIRELL